MVAFFDTRDPAGENFNRKWGNKYMTITGTCNGKTRIFNAVIADTCNDRDCGGCCTANANKQTGYLIDMEYYTAIRQFGTTACADVKTNLQFSVDLNQAPVVHNCGPGPGGCADTNACCSFDFYCGYTTAYCGNGCNNQWSRCG
jgi:hypothetical protein